MMFSQVSCSASRVVERFTVRLLSRPTTEVQTHEENIAENKYDTLGLEAATWPPA